MTSQITIGSLLAGPTKDDVAKSAADAKAGQIAIANRNNIWKTDLDAETIARLEAMMPQRETTMTTKITTAGYIVHDGDLIHGYGATADLAWEDMLNTMEAAQITILGDDDDSADEQGSWIRESGMKIQAASAALIQEVEECGGAIGWRTVGGVACTRDEAEA